MDCLGTKRIASLSSRTRSTASFFLLINAIASIFLAGYETGNPERGSYAAARASNERSALRDIARAAADYAQQNAFFDGDENQISLLHPYLDRPEKFVPARFAFRVVSGVLWAGNAMYDYDMVFPNAPMREKLESLAPKALLYGSNSLDVPPASDDAAHLYKREKPVVWMRVRLPDTASRDGAGE